MGKDKNHRKSREEVEGDGMWANDNPPSIGAIGEAAAGGGRV